MTLAAIGLVTVVLAAEPQGKPDAAARKLIEKSLPFLEKEGVAWLDGKKCATCHHVPMMLWTHYEAKKQGFAVNDKPVERLETDALRQYLGHPQLQPTGQDQGFLEKPLGMGTVYLTLALAANSFPKPETAKAIERLKANFVKHQNENGSWTTKANQPPLVDGHDATTMLILAAMVQGGAIELQRPAWERAAKWLKEMPTRDETQPMAFRVLVAKQAGRKDDLQRSVEALRGEQRPDGGWRQTKDRPTDALATGQALYALGVAGTAPDDAAVRGARKFLAMAQREDGSWLIHSRNPKSHDPVISYFATGWATLGLLRTLPK